MLNQRLSVVRTITTGLAQLEEHLDDAMISHARLQADVVSGRRSAHLPLDAGQAGMDLLSEATAALNAARRLVHEAHYAFRADRDRMRLPTVSYGDYGDTPEALPRNAEAGTPILSVVSAA